MSQAGARGGSGAASARLLSRELAGAPKDIQKLLRPTLRAAAQPVLADARMRAGWSSRIPRSLRLTTSFAQRGGGVFLRSSLRLAPHARAYENLGVPGTFRHPVFGHDVWVTQTARPYLFPAVRANETRIVQALEGAVDRTLRIHGFS